MYIRTDLVAITYCNLIERTLFYGDVFGFGVCHRQTTSEQGVHNTLLSSSLPPVPKLEHHVFVPAHYQPRGGDWTLETVLAYPLAMLVTSGETSEAIPWITHLPVIPHPGHTATELGGALLVGHMNAANPHWRAVCRERRSTLVFTGPQGYVSPTLYGVPVAAPTWNFVSVHAHGTLHPLATSNDALQVVCWTVEALERRHGFGWTSTDSLTYFRKILPGVRAFEFLVDSVDGMYKLSQEQQPDIRKRVIEYFSTNGSGSCAELSALMKNLVEGTTTHDHR